MSTKYGVTICFDLSRNFDVIAETPEEAADMAYEEAGAISRLCHHCAHDYDLGDAYRAVVIDENDNEVLDDGYAQKQIAELTAEVERLRAPASYHNRVAELMGDIERLRSALATAVATLERDGDEWGICNLLRSALAGKEAQS